jgi:hypothetical protein
MRSCPHRFANSGRNSRFSTACFQSFFQELTGAPQAIGVPARGGAVMLIYSAEVRLRCGPSMT